MAASAFFREAIESQRVQRQAARRLSGEDPPVLHGHQQVITMPIFFASNAIYRPDIIRAGWRNGAHSPADASPSMRSPAECFRALCGSCALRPRSRNSGDL